jgi:hypothetical protein
MEQIAINHDGKSPGEVRLSFPRSPPPVTTEAVLPTNARLIAPHTLEVAWLLNAISRCSVRPVYATMAWDEGAVEGWTVMGQLRKRRAFLRNQAIQARRRQERRRIRTNLPAVAFEGAARDEAIAKWSGSTELVALLFAPPDASAMRVLENRLDYFDVRSGDKWSLFFPGYYEQRAGTNGPRRDAFVGESRPRGTWKFDPVGFDSIREHVSRQSNASWRYSGETDIVLIGAWLPEDGEIVVDWGSIRSGILAEPGIPTSSHSLGALVEAITNSFDELIDPTIELESFLTHEKQPPQTSMREFTTQVLSGVAAALLVHGLHLA